MSQTKELQATIQKALEYGSMFGNATFHWNPEKKELYLKDISYFKRVMKVKVIFQIVFGLLMLYEVVTNPKLDGTMLKSQATFTSAIVLMGGDGTWNQLSQYFITIQTINEFMKLEIVLEKDGNHLPGKSLAIVGILCKILLSSAKTVAFFGLPAFFMPEFPTNLFLFMDDLLGGPKSNTMLVTERIVFGAGNIMVWYVIGSAAVFFWMEMIFTLTCMRACLLLCLRKVSNGSSTAIFCFYRRLNLLVTLFNEAHSSVVIHLLGAVTFVQTLSAFILIRTFRNNQDLNLIAIFCNIVAIINISVIILGIYGYAGSVYSTSVLLTNGLKMNEKILHNKIARKTALSMQSLKIKFGGSNFIDKRTPLIFLDFNIGRTVDLLLIDKRLHR